MKMSSEPRDRLSELHDSLIFNIFEFLPMKYVVRTQILSHRWKNLWTLTPYLCFENETSRDNIDFRNFVYRTLSSWRGTRVQKFKVSGIACEHIRLKYRGVDNRENPLFIDIDSWLRFAVDNGVEDLDLSSGDDESVSCKRYCVHQCLYSSSSLKKLSLSGNDIEVTGNAVQWNQLLSLTIIGFGVSARAVKQILCGSPRLEVFNFSFESSDDNVKLNFRSSSLKGLSICKSVGDEDYMPSMDTELIIWTPNLQTLRIEGVPYRKCLLKNVSSLTHVTIWFDQLFDYDESFGPDFPDDFYANDYLEGTLRQMLPAIRHVEGLTLWEWSVQVLINMNIKSTLSTFSNVKFLSLTGTFEEHVQILGLLEIFPALETLVIKEEQEVYNESKLEFKWNPSMYFLGELRTIEVTWCQYDLSIFPLLKSLLAYARKLEKMVFRSKEVPWSVARPPNFLFLASQKLLRLPRSSPAAELIFCEN